MAEAVSAVGGLAAGLLVVYLAVLALVVVSWVKILSKAGYSGWWVLVGLVPLLNVVMFLVFAFSEWPVVRAARASGYGNPGYGPPAPGYAPPAGGYELPPGGFGPPPGDYPGPPPGA